MVKLIGARTKSATTKKSGINMRTPLGVIIYSGPSRLDGMPIIVIATRGSSNRKTGDVVQTFILRRDSDPLTISHDKADYSICGDCVHRRSKGGACYVTLHQAPRAVYAGYKRGIYPAIGDSPKFKRAVQGKMVRLGAYGDPVAVPIEVWHALLGITNAGHTGYTHQWMRPSAQEYKSLCMASTDSGWETVEAQSKGWRTFEVIQPGHEPHTGFECPAVNKGRTCQECQACYGSRNREVQPASVWIRAHGPLVSRMQKDRYLITATSNASHVQEVSQNGQTQVPLTTARRSPMLTVIQGGK